MPDVVEQFQRLKKQRDELERQRIEAKTLADTHKAESERILKELSEQFGVATIEDAKQLLSQMEESVAEKVAELEQKLAKFEAPTGIDDL